MKNYQRCNHFPGMYNLAWKNQLCMNLDKLWKRYPKDYSFYPKTWMVPNEFKELKAFFNKQPDENEDGTGIWTFIVKPESSC